MTDTWDFFFLLVDDQPASIFVDLGIAAEAPLGGFPHMGYVRVEMLRPREDGLSSQEEFSDLCALDDDLTARLAAAGGAIYVGRNTSGGCRDFYFYAADATQFTSAAEAAVARHPSYRCEIGSRPDPAWTVYFDFLSPSDDDRQRMASRGVREALERHGDVLTEARPIDHRAYFRSRDAAAALFARLERDGFQVQLPKAVDEGEFAIDFVRADSPADMDDVAVTVARLVRELGGEYDGWGCPVVLAKQD